jgi:hypothetical protein
MLTSLFSWLRHSCPKTTVRKPCSTSLRLEQLDDRLLPSASTVSAISVTHYGFTEHDLYEVNSQTQQVEYFQTADVNGPTYFYHNTFGAPYSGARIRAVSATLDPNTTYPEFFALDSYGTLYLHDINWTWHSLGGGYSEISATRDGHVFALDSVGQNLYYVDTAAHSTYLGSPNTRYYAYSWTIHDISASVDQFGQNVAYVAAIDGAIYMHVGSSSSAPWKLIDNSAYFNYVSAPQAGLGVFGLDNNGHVHEVLLQAHSYVSPSLGWVLYYTWNDRDVSYGDTYTAISADTDAAGNPEVYAIDYSSNLERISNAGPQWQAYNVTNVAGAGGGYHFFVTYGRYVFGNDPTLSNWIYFGTY